MFQISLARKCQLLFGFAVVLIIAAALFVPGYFMETFVHELHLRRARQMAMLAHARLDPTGPDWREQQAALDQWWNVHVVEYDETKALKLPSDVRPKLIQLRPTISDERMEQERRYINACLQESVRWLSHTKKWAGRWADVSSRGRWIKVASKVLSAHRVTRAIEGGRSAMHKLAEAFVAGMYPPLDEFQQDCVNQMLRDRKLDEMASPIQQPMTSTAYRFVLGVRGPGPPAEPGPLLGIIYVELPPDDLLVFARVSILLAGVMAGFLAILVFYLVSQRLILAPVRELKDLVEKITGGELNARANLTTGDEFEELSDAFNDMLTRLERARTELEAANRGLDAKLGELAETNVALYESNRLKSEFLANVSHELRTPLASIIGFADLLRDSMQDAHKIDTSRAARYAHNILTSGRGLLDLINDLLDLAKMEARRIELHRAVFSLRDVCEALNDFVRPMVDRKSLTMIVQLEDNLPLMNSDAGKLRQILFNLLSNAIKYTPDGGTITLQAAGLDAGKQVRLVVTDTGPGIAPEDQGGIFEKFHQLDASVTREHSGTGLGLAISKELCTLLGGTIRVESELGQGARFIVELPIECAKTVERPLPSMT